ncbi:restriction endonuclease subunit S [Neisseria lactamica]|uniref:restriction endonuclease subunit S n=2 Tax=Neisseria lactamica TaxID=486 RepID=UPI000E58E528
MDMQSKAKKLIEMIQTAPVEWKPLGEVLVRTKGTKITAGQMKEMHKDNAPLKIFAGGKTFALVDFDDVPDKDIHREPSIIVKSRGIIEFEYYDKPFSHKNEMWSYHSVNKHIYIKYVYYFLKTQENYFRNIGSKMQMPQIATPDTDNYKIPIPPLETQQKIVKILDKLTELEAMLETALEAELALRKCQYQYYRDFLLDFDNQIGGGIADGYQCRLKDVVWKTLGEVGEVRMCKRILKDQTSSFGDVPFYKIGTFGKNPNSYISRKLFEEYKEKYHYPRLGEVLISASGTIGRTVIFDGQDAYFQDSNIVWIENDEKQVLNKYLFYFYQIAKWDIAEGGTIPRLYNENLRKMLVPIPPLAEQEKIVAILDKFDTLTHSISEGLPHEIALRRKQYEYYREQLLAFPKAA